MTFQDSLRRLGRLQHPSRHSDNAFDGIGDRPIEAERAYRERIAEMDRNGGSELELLPILHDLAKFYIREGKIKEAESALNRGLASPGGDASVEIWRAAFLQTFGDLQFGHGDYVGAEARYRAAFAIKASLLGEANADTVNTMNGLGVALMEQAKYAEAGDILTKGLAILEKGVDPAASMSFSILVSLGNLASKQGDRREAEAYYRRSLRLAESNPGLDPGDLALLLDNLSALLMEMGRGREAEELLRRSLKIQATKAGDLTSATAKSHLAGLLASEGRLTEAEAIMRDVVALNEMVLGPRHPTLAITLNNLGRIYAREGKDADAEETLHRAISIKEHSLGRNHPSLAANLEALATVYLRQAKYALAEALYIRAVRLVEQSLGDEHPQLAPLLINLAGVYLETDRLNSAEHAYQRALSLSSGPGEELYDTEEDALYGLALLSEKQGRLPRAEGFIAEPWTWPRTTV